MRVAVIGAGGWGTALGIVAAALLPLAVWSLSMLGISDRAPRPLLVLSILGAALIVLMHRANIGRLLRGEESKLK